MGLVLGAQRNQTIQMEGQGTFRDKQNNKKKGLGMVDHWG